MTPASPQSAPFPSLRLPCTKAEERIAAQIDAGQELLRMAHASQYSLSEVHAEHTKWHSKNEIMLRGLFEPPDEMLEQYGRATPPAIHLQSTARSAVPAPPGMREREEAKTIQGRIDALDVIKDTLQYFTDVEAAPQAGPADGAAPVRRDVFVVHGHDEAAKEAVARLIERLELRAIILHELPNKGRTIIEKFEDYSNVGHAVVLLTPDDICESTTDQGAQFRARQNVIFELGFFVGKLGRKRVCVLYKEGVEIPSDYEGVIFEPMDDAQGWRLKVAKEMKEAGMDVDLNKL